MRDALEKKPKLSLADAKELIAKCMEVLFYRLVTKMMLFEIFLFH